MLNVPVIQLNSNVLVQNHIDSSTTIQDRVIEA